MLTTLVTCDNPEREMPAPLKARVQRTAAAES
jgi:hypothetical protein